jgi:5-methyltetrahydrofolate--homocysteine methyltransferase
VTYDPLTELMAYYSGRTAAPAATQPKGTVAERLKARIIEGNKAGLQSDLDEALRDLPPLDIINRILLDGMKTVGELFGSGQMQLPFVLQSAEVMKAAVAYLEPSMERTEVRSRGVMVIATVKGDVHDIGKNLVDIILTNNGYTVINLGIKCPIDTILQATEEHRADAVGMSGLLVKSTLIMKENLEVMNERDIHIPVVLGGAALTRRFVEQDLRKIYHGTLVYANDAFDGLRFMENLMAGSIPEADLDTDSSVNREELTGSEAKVAMIAQEMSQHPTPDPQPPTSHSRPGLRSASPIPSPPFWGSRIVTSIPIAEVFRYVNERALIRGQWQVKKAAMKDEEYDRLVASKILPMYEKLKADIMAYGLLEPQVVYGYFPCQSDGDDLIVYGEDRRTERTRFSFPRQKEDRHLCIADFFAPVESCVMDVVAFHLVTMGEVAGRHSAELFGGNRYADYLYFHGLSVEAAEALAELWHKRIREELGIAGKDATDIKRLFAQGYQGARYSFGYPACPNLGDQVKLMELLEGERIGVTLSDEYQLIPEQSTTAIIVHHADARYFTV